MGRKIIFLTASLVALSLAPVAFAANPNAQISPSITLTAGSASYSLPLSTVDQWKIETPDLVYNPDYDSEIENNNFCQYEKSFVCLLTFAVRNNTHIEKITRVTWDTAAIRNFVNGLAQQTDKDPVDAKFQMTNGKVSIFALSSDGIKINEDQTVKLILGRLKNNTFSGTIAIPYTTEKPEISTNSIVNLGITSLIGEGRSNFVGSPKDRVINIEVAIKKFNGTLIGPGEEFSFLKTLGPVDAAHGYLPELSIVGNETEPEYGGGICQVSTTVFRAALYSGLKITDRTNHAYPVSYYNPQGMDATVYIPSPDLRFINNTPGYILIQARIEGTELIFDFYGTDDGRKTTIEGPTILERQPDGSMKTTLSQTVVAKNGKTIINDTFNSNYNSPYLYPDPGAAPLTQKPANWSKDEWNQYKKAHNID